MPDQLSALEALQHENAALRQRVAELEEIEQHVRESEATYRALFDNMEDGISLHEVIPYDAEDGVNFRIFAANPAFQRQTGLTAADLRGPARRETLAWVNPHRLQLLNQVALTGEPVDAEYYSDKFQRHFHLRAFSLQPDRFAISVQDITARQQAEEALRQSEAKYRLLFENMQEGFSLHEIICDDTGRVIDFRFLEANAAYEQHTGLKPQAIVGKTMLEIMPQADRRQIEQYGRVALTGEPLTFEYYSKTFNRHVRVRAFCPEHGRFATIFEDITARQQAEAALRLSAEQLREAQALAHIGSWEWDLPRQTLTWSDEVYRIFGAAPGELAVSAEVFESFIHPDDRDDFLKRRATMLAETHRAVIDHRIIRRDGAVRWVQEQAQVLLDEHGQTTRVTGTVQDITNRHQMEEALREREEKYRSVVMALNEGLLLQNAAGQIITCNPVAEQILGLTLSQLQGQLPIDPAWHTVRADGSPLPFDAFPAMISLRTGQAVRNMEAGLYKPSGELLWVSINSEPLFLPGDNLPYAVVASFTDITERKRMEDALRQSEQKFHTAVETMLDGFALMSAVRDPAGCITDFRYDYINEAGSRLNRRSTAEQLGHTILEVQPALRDTGYIAELAQVVDTGQSLAKEALPVPVATGDHEETHYFDARVVKCGDGFTITWHEVTERRQMEEALRASHELLAGIINTVPARVFWKDRTLHYLEDCISQDSFHLKQDFRQLKAESVK